MSAVCPQCKEKLTWSIKERLTAKFTDGLTLTCQKCNTQLLIDYWSLKQFTYIQLRGISVIALYFLLKQIGVSGWLFMVLLISYGAIMLFLHYHSRKAIYADSRLNQPKASPQPWNKP